VLACAEGLDHQTVARRVRVAPATVGRWRRRFLAARVAGLMDDPRPGAPRQITDAQVEAVIVRTLERTPKGPPTGARATWPRPWGSVI
jgi:transposase